MPLKKIIVMIIELSLSMALLTAEGWNYNKSIKIGGNSTYQAVFLDEEVYQMSRSDLGDLRIVSDQGEFIPYFIRHGNKLEEEAEIRYTAIPVKASLSADRDFKEYHFKITGDNILISRLKFMIIGPDFSVPVKIYGSRDEEVWQFIKSDTLYSINGYIKEEANLDGLFSYNFYKVEFPSGIDLPRLITPYLSHPDRQYVDYKKEQELNFKLVKKARESELIIQNPNKLKILSLDFNIEGNFNRRFDLYSASELIFSGDLFYFQHQFENHNQEISGTKIEFPFSPLSGKEFRTTIQDNDNTPLTIKGIKCVYIIDQLVFEAQRGKAYYLYFGNPTATAPVYDIEKLKTYIKSEELCTLGKIEANGELPKADKTDNIWSNKLFFNLSLALASLILITILILGIKKK